MRIYLDTTIKELFDVLLISKRTYNCLCYAGIVTLEDVLKYAESPVELLKLKNFGRKCYTEIEPLFREVQLQKRPNQAETPENLQQLIEESSHQDKDERFITPIVREFLQSVYVRMRKNLLKTRANNLIEHAAPRFEDLAKYFDSPMRDYNKLCPGQSMMKTLTEIFNFNQLFKEQFDRYWQMSDEEVQSAMLKRDYPYLSSLERRFVMEHGREYGVYPMFFLLYNYMRISEVRSNKIFSLLYGIFDGKERTLNELAEVMGLTRERIRQIASKKLEVHNTELIKTDAWKSYDELLSLSFVTVKSSEYQIIKEREHLNFDFCVFARLMQLLGDYETEIVCDVAVVINRKMMPSIKIRDSVDSLQALVSSRYTNDTRIEIKASLNTMPTEEKAEAVKLMSYIAREGLELEVDDEDRVFVQKNHIDVTEDLYTILAKKGEPMSVDELFATFKQKYPDHKYTEPGQIRTYLFRHPNIKPIGNTSRYGLDSWDNVFFGTIRDLLAKLLEESEEPVHIEQLYDAVKEHYPNTNIKSVEYTMKGSDSARFVQFNDGFYGLKSKVYDAKWVEYDVAARQRQSFDDRLADFCEFVDSYNRYPVSGNGEDEASLYRWLYNVQNEVYEIKDEYKVMLAETLGRYEQEYIPRNLTENEFRSNCQRYKDYINSHYALPTISTEPELYSWMIRSKANYNSYVDHRRKYLTDLFNYILSLGFSI